MTILDIVPAGVVTGKNLLKVFEYAHEHKFSIPAINCSSTSTINAALEASRDNKSPIIIQFSQNGAAFIAGKGVDNSNQEAYIIGAIAGAQYVRTVSKSYGIPVILHSDHCDKSLLPWLDGMLEADEQFFKVHGEPLFSSHMLDLSEQDTEENISTCVKYLHRMAPIDCWLEMEIGITGGEDVGTEKPAVENPALYTQPEDIWEVYRRLSQVSKFFSIAAAFGNVHGVYSPGNVTLQPELLQKHQDFVARQLKCENRKPVFFVFHGGSGSTEEEISSAVKNGVVKMNVDTDTQWAYWEGVKNYYETKKEYLQTQVGNPEGKNKPNKRYYNPRAFIREGEKSMIRRVQQVCDNLGSTGAL